jgi:hypothetical protein
MRTLILGGLLLAGSAHADGGVLRRSQAAGPFVLSVFTAPEPLRVGRADVSVLVQARGGASVVLDASVELRLRAPDGSEQMVAAAHAAASNRLLQSAWVELPVPGRWALAVTARRASDVATVSCELDVAASAPRLSAQWLPLGLPVLCILVFVWRERLLRRRRR